ncbi:Panacea domain-containing protein [Micromonospora zamorensis]|uniref:Panacea domain-containing protein n=1 Tax=Micromonospora zamorensis TaxID=709883 RepID=UPI00352AB14F|nr:Panacea domain-containing protein [Micromonospora zamorensis]
MAATAHTIAAELRRRLPGLGTKKLHKLLYYCQGHHLATFNRALFDETISAWDMGPVVGTLWRQEKDGEVPAFDAELGEAELNTVGYVISRYGNLTGNDLEHLTHSETPWRLANTSRSPGGSVPIRHEWIKGYFQTEGAATDGPAFDTAQVRDWLYETSAAHEPGDVDSIDALRARMTAGV